MKEIYNFLHSYFFKIFINFFTTAISMLIFSFLFFYIYFIYNLNNITGSLIQFDFDINSIIIDATLNSIKLTFIVFVIVCAIVTFIISKKNIKPLKDFNLKIENMINEEQFFSLNEEGLFEFKKLSQYWNFLLYNTIHVKEQNEMLEYKSDIDGLTKLYNHTYFINHLEEELQRKNIQISLIFFDIDKFKSINDTYGHLIGDKILAIVSKIIKSILIKEGLTKSSLVGRYGGEEITVMLINIDINTAFLIAEKIRLKIYNSEEIKEIISDRIVSISAGIASTPLESNEVSELIEKADIAMYHSKNNGRNQSTIYSPLLKK